MASSKKYHATNPPVPYERRERWMGEVDLMSIFFRQFVGAALRPWMWEKDKLFEWALVVYAEGTSD
ncbi:unnamed protein product, partial [Musa textilis]